MGGSPVAGGNDRHGGKLGPPPPPGKGGAYAGELASRRSPLHGSPMSFVLHPRLAAGCFDLGTKCGCRVLLKDNALFPWVIVVPEVEEGVEDLHQLDPDRWGDVMVVIRSLSCFVSEHFRPDKLNVACIGNQVRQMHIHIVGRSPGDPAWPGVVWAFEGKQPYTPEAAEAIREAAAKWLEGK